MTLKKKPSKPWLAARPMWFRVHPIIRMSWISYLISLSPFRPKWKYNASSVRVFLLVRDLYSQLHGLIDSFVAQGVPRSNIYILDSGTTSPECLAALAALVEQGICILELSSLEQQFGPYALWLSPRLWHLVKSSHYPYIVTDSDLTLSNLDDLSWLKEMFFVLNSCRFVSKVSLPLRTNDIDAAAKLSIVSHEESLYRRPLYKILTCLFCRDLPSHAICATDTTLSLYRPGLFYSTFSIRLPFSLSIRHLPWYSKYTETDEFSYYKSRKFKVFGDWSSPSTNNCQIAPPPATRNSSFK